MADEFTLGEQETLDEALQAALPTRDGLNRAFYFTTGKQLENICPPASTTTLTQCLLVWLNANPDKIRPFLKRALRDVPGNPKLSSFVKDYCRSRSIEVL